MIFSRQRGFDLTNAALVALPIVAYLATIGFASVIVRPLTADIPICSAYEIAMQPDKPELPSVDPESLPKNWKACAGLRTLQALPAFDHLHIRQPIAAEVRARYAWSALYALGMIGAAGITLYCCATMFSFLGARRAWRRVTAASLIAAVVVVASIGTGALTNSLVRQMFDNSLDVLPAPHWTNHSLGGVVRICLEWANGLTVVTIVFIVVAAASTAARLRQRDSESGVAEIAIRLKALSRITYAASIGLVLVTLAGYQLFSWPATVLPKGAAAVEIYQAIAQGIVILTGSSLTMLLAISYLAPAAVLLRRANRLVPHTLSATPGQDKWLKDHGVDLAPRQQLAQLASFLLPLLTAAGTTLFKDIPLI